MPDRSIPITSRRPPAVTTGSGPRSFWSRLVSRISGREPVPIESELSRLEEKRCALKKATDQWLSLLRDMEQQGQSGDAAYDRYYKAYMDAKRQQKQIEMLLFNMQQQRAS